jgi:hypothetical protein
LFQYCVSESGCNREHTEFTEKEHKFKSDLKDVEKNLNEWKAQQKAAKERGNELAIQVIIFIQTLKRQSADTFLSSLPMQRVMSDMPGTRKASAAFLITSFKPFLACVEG